LGDDDKFYIPSKPAVSGLLQFVRALILYGYLIPISLYVSIEVVKVLQAMLINKDTEMYDEETCMSVRARISNLNEELGHVEIVLLDKTGMLTRNQMEFRKCSIAGISYGGDINEVDLAASKRMNDDDVEAYRFSVDESSTGSHSSHSYELFEFSVGDISTEKAILGGKEEDVENQGMGNSRISDMGKEFVIKGFNFRDGRLMNNQWMCRFNVNTHCLMR
jgi:phospholipid-translocating ATPase